MCPELLEKIFLYLIESNPQFSQSNENKKLYSDLRLVCKDWCNVASTDIVWRPRVLALHFACLGNYFNGLKLYGKALHESKLELLDERWQEYYKLQIEIVNCTTGELLYYAFGSIEVEVLIERQTRLGIINDSAFIQCKTIQTKNLPSYLKNIKVRIIAHQHNKFAVLFDSTVPILISPRQPGGYFKLPNNTFFCSTKKIQYMKNEFKAYVCFDLIKKENTVEFHKATEDMDKYSSSMAYLINCSVEDLGIFFRNLNWKM